jgi:hypothetical protein
MTMNSYSDRHFRVGAQLALWRCMRLRLPVLVLTLLASALLPRAASATPLTWEFSGVVDKVSGSGWTSINLGDAFAWTVTFDPSTPNQAGCPAGSGEYTGAIQASTLSIGQYFWTGGWGAIEANAPAGTCGNFDTGVSFREFNWSGNAPAGTRLPFEVVATLFYLLPSDGSIPTIPPSSARVQVNSPFNASGGPSALTTVTEVPVPVPEPATLTLVGSGLAMMLRRRFVRRRRAQMDPASTM